MMVLIHRGAIHALLRADEIRAIHPHTTWETTDSTGEDRVIPACVEVEWLNGTSLLLICDSLRDPKLMERFIVDLQAAIILALAWKSPGDPVGRVEPIADVPATAPRQPFQPRRR